MDIYMYCPENMAPTSLSSVRGVRRVIRLASRLIQSLEDNLISHLRFLISGGKYAAADRSLKDFLDLDSTKGKSVHVITISVYYIPLSTG